MIFLPCRKPELYNYSPHKNRMLLIEQLDQYDLIENKLSSSIKITESSEFFCPSDNYVPVWISFEYMAQSIAILSGISHADDGDEPKIGFIIGVRDFKAAVPGFKPGDELVIFVEQTFRDGNVAVFNGEVLINDKVCSSAIINVIENNQELVNRWICESK
ncbi:MAG: hypothetical protein PF518_10430 [Spirochaetaceae bacterium]|jgi:predicted hotdog family 3-hydroxylacyl-ACP dehydratase|nr:hypothetical protein [Spirochaetaceae bacterium]